MGHPTVSFGSPVLLAGRAGTESKCSLTYPILLKKKKYNKIHSLLLLILFDIGESHERLLKMLKTKKFPKATYVLFK